MKFTTYYKKHSFTFGMDFTTITAPVDNSYPENNTPHRRH
jgi:hypothetical protein